MKLLACLITTAAASAVLNICLVTMDSNITPAAAGFTLWAISPYGGLLLLLRKVRRQAAGAILVIMAPVVAGGGAWLIYNAMFIHNEAQSALALAVVPLWQWALIIPAGLLFYYLIRKTKA